MKQKQLSKPTHPVRRFALLLAAAGGIGLYLLAPKAAHDTAADVAPPVLSMSAPTSAATPTQAPSPEATLAQRPATLPPGIVLVSTQPEARPPQATLLLDGQLQAQPQGTHVAGSALLLRGVTADAVTLGLADGQVLYTLPVSPAEEVRQRMADARSARLAERAAAPTAAASGERVVQHDAGQTAPLPDAMKVTVNRRRPSAPGPVGGL
ncbi:hypothetical protein [Sphaerotilus sp.]|uniref:hypothetical protein n=1 Tax=Sphaerotilus sp. TaxID=2093942 RepID=UPI0034E2A0F9